MEKNVPKLRFPEFNGEWKEKILSKLSENGFSNGAFNDPKKVGSGYRIINVKDMYVDGTINVDNLTKVALDEKEFLKNRVEYGDLFFTRSSLVKEGIAFSNVNLNRVDDLTFDGHLIRMRPNQKISSPVFLYYCFSTNGTRKQFIQKGKTTTMTTIGQEDIATVEIHIPSLPEQTKIASFLTAVDDKLNSLKKKKQLLEQYKKGVMQQIFSQQLRFKDDNGEDFAEWEEKKLGEVLIKNSIKNKGQKYSLVQSVSNKYGFINQDEMFEDRRVASKDTSNYYIIEKGCFAYNPSRIDVGSLAYKDDDVISVISPLYITFKTNSEFLTDEFLLNWFSTEQFIMQMNSSFEGSVRNTLSYESLSKMDISIPTLPEQTKIANFLSAIDDKIYHCGTQIEKMEGWKKGLLQGMFV